MGIPRKKILVLLLTSVAFVMVLHRETSSQETRRKGQGPPPEAYAVCEGKNAGAKAQMTGPRGETITGLCDQEGERLVLRPDNFPAGPGGRMGQGPPPEAYAACEGKKAGAKAQMKGPRAETVTGTCEQEGNRMVLRPDRSHRAQ